MIHAGVGPCHKGSCTLDNTHVSILMQLIDTFSRGHGGREDGSLTFGDVSISAGIPQAVQASYVPTENRTRLNVLEWVTK